MESNRVEVGLGKVRILRDLTDGLQQVGEGIGSGLRIGGRRSVDDERLVPGAALTCQHFELVPEFGTVAVVQAGACGTPSLLAVSGYLAANSGVDLIP